VPETDWVQLDGFTTHDEHRITPRFTDLSEHFHDEGTGPHAGPIPDAEFIDDVYLPATDYAQQPVLLAQRNDRRISYAFIREWLDTLGGGGLGSGNYDAGVQFWGSVAGVHDWNPLAWEAETRAEILADFDASPPPGVTFRYLEWETNPFQLEPFGTYTNRVIKISLEDPTVTNYNRDGSVAETVAESPIPHGIVAFGRDGTPSADNYDWTYDADQDWYILDATPGVNTLQDAGTDGEVLTEFSTSVDIPISDAWWNANAYTGGGSAEGVPATNRDTLALPLMLGPATAINATPDLAGSERSKSWRQTGFLAFEHDWTPPRYRIVYTTTPVAPVLRHFPRKGDGRGWGGVTRGYPPNPSRRGYGGARQP
jgi:hypothetical protein